MLNNYPAVIRQVIAKKFKFKGFQLADYASAAMHDGVILGHDTGGGKGLALYVWPCLKVGFRRPNPSLATRHSSLEPLAPVLLVAPGDLHKQVMDEGREKFRATTTVLDTQAAFLQLSTINPRSGRRELPPGFYLTSYTQLGTNGVAEFPRLERDNPAGMMAALNLKAQDIEDYFDQRGVHYRRHYQRISEYAACGPESTVTELRDAWQRARRLTPELAGEFDDAYDVVKHFAGPFKKLSQESFAFVQRCMIRFKHGEYSQFIGESLYVKGGHGDRRKIKCVYSPSLADLSADTFACVAVDEGVKMKGEDTLVGLGVRQMHPRYRLVLTATPIKNRLPDIFRLAWWAAGGNAEANPRWPYADETAARDEFAEEFLISERNASADDADGEKKSYGRKKLTPQVCNVHRLWKLLAPNVLRRRKKDFGEDIVAKHRHIVRVPLGRRQAEVYEYHLLGKYTYEKNGQTKRAIGPQLQALRIAAANAASTLLTPHPSPGNKNLLCRTNHSYIPKLHAALKLVHQVLARGEQVVVFSAFHDSLDVLSARLHEAGVNHIVADGRMTQKKRGEAIKKFKQGGPRAVREGHCVTASKYPVLLAGVESVAEGHSMNLCNNVILMCYSWAYDRFEQAINRAHRLNSPWDVNVFPIICDGSIDRKLEAMIQEKGDAAELVLDGHLLGEHSSEVNLAELLDTARREFHHVVTVDEVELEKQWPPLRAELAQLAAQWARPIGKVLCEEPASIKQIEQPMIPRHESNRPAKRNTRAHSLIIPSPLPAGRGEGQGEVRVPRWRKRVSSSFIAPKLDTSIMPLWRQQF